jgi:hypothetical protein
LKEQVKKCQKENGCLVEDLKTEHDERIIHQLKIKQLEADKLKQQKEISKKTQYYDKIIQRMKHEFKEEVKEKKRFQIKRIKLLMKKDTQKFKILEMEQDILQWRKEYFESVFDIW